METTKTATETTNETKVGTTRIKCADDLAQVVQLQFICWSDAVLLAIWKYAKSRELSRERLHKAVDKFYNRVEACQNLGKVRFPEWDNLDPEGKSIVGNVPNLTEEWYREMFSGELATNATSNVLGTTEVGNKLNSRAAKTNGWSRPSK